jgi:TonB family protein
VIGADGKVERSSVVVVNSTNKAFDEPAIEAIMACTNKPAKIRGSPVRQLVEQVVRFTIGG